MMECRTYPSNTATRLRSPRLWARRETEALVPVQLTPDGANAANYAFDVTPSRLVTGLITERGVAEASKAALVAMYPDKALQGKLVCVRCPAR